MAPIDSIKEAAGLYRPDRFIPIIAAIVNLILSIILVKLLGLVGVFIGTLASTILLSFWIKPVLVYRHILKKNVTEYFKDIALKISFTVIFSIICLEIGEKLFFEYNVINFIGRFIICLIIPNFTIYLLSYRTNEFKYLVNLLKPILPRIKLKQVV